MQGFVAVFDDLRVHPQAGDRAQVLAVSHQVTGSAFPGGELRGDRMQRAFQHGATVLEIAAGRGKHCTAGDGHERLRAAVPFHHGQLAGENPQRHIRRDRGRRAGGWDGVSEPGGQALGSQPQRLGSAVAGHNAVHPLGRVGRQRPGGDVGFHLGRDPG